MTTVNQLKTVSETDPHGVLALRIDVVRFAVAWYDSLQGEGSIEDAEQQLYRAIRRYKHAVKCRTAPTAHLYRDAT
jgi:hypothetical protein